MTQPCSSGSEPTFEQALGILASFFDSEKTGRIPFQREGYSLEPLRRYLAERDALQPCPRILHVGGSKGKSSVTTLASALLHQSGLSVGSFTSPHLVSYRERIRLDGRPIEPQTFARQVIGVLGEKPDPGGSPMRSVFEALTATALLLFKARAMQAAVVEVGLGGRLDATNILHSDASVLTPISLDHTEVLGSTIRAIALDKSGILRPERPVVIGPQEPEVQRLLKERARSLGAVPIVFGEDYHIEHEQRGFRVCFADGWSIGRLCPAMAGTFQEGNVAVAIAACRAVIGDLDPDAVRQVVATTRHAGRMQEIALGDGGTLLLDGAHSPFSAETLAAELRRHYPPPRALLLAVASNKDVPGVLRPLLPLGDPVLLCSLGGPRATPPERLAELSRKLGHPTTRVFSEPAEAWRHWLSLRRKRPLLVVTGSLFLVGRLLAILHEEGRIELDPPPDPVSASVL